MGRIQGAFKNGTAFIGFVTGGDPTIEATKEIILEMDRAGADLIEIGIPFSDPIAEGIVIQEANLRALAHRTTVDTLFAMVAELRRETQVPLVFLTYLNPVYHYGYDSFFTRCKDVGIDGIIIPDLPFEEKGEVVSVADGYGVAVISLVAPTSEDRIRTIASDARGFLYVVSSMGVTGVRSEIKTDLEAIVSAAKKVSPVPVAVGFGINTPAQAKEIGTYADGVIVGSAIVKIIAEHGENAAPYVADYVQQMKAALE